MLSTDFINLFVQSVFGFNVVLYLPKNIGICYFAHSQ